MPLKLVQPNYLPSGFEGRNAWLQNFAAQLPTFAAGLGVTASQSEAVANAAVLFNHLVTVLVPYARSYSKGLTSLMEEADTDSTPQGLTMPPFTPPPAPQISGAVLTGIFNMVTTLVNNTILASPALTPQIRSALGLDAPTPPAPGQVLIRSSEALPGGQVDLTLLRAGAPLIIIEGRRGEEAEFSMLDKIAATHFLDARPNAVPGTPEFRDYRIRRSDGTQGVGQYSPISTIATMP